MIDRTVDFEKLRRSLQELSRGHLLIIAQRAIEQVPSASLPALVGDLVQIDIPESSTVEAPSLLEEVRSFHAASRRGEYYKDFPVHSHNCTEMSTGTDAFIAEFDRHVVRCLREAHTGARPEVREAFELLFGLLRHIDECLDDVLFFADEGGAWNVQVDWRAVLPVYFRCLAETVTAEEFARTVDQTIGDFANHDRGHHLSQARRVAIPEQQAALGALAAAPR